jgi:hypothetical protein
MPEVFVGRESTPSSGLALDPPGPIVSSAYMCGGRAAARGCDGRGYALAAVVLLALVRPSEENFRDFAASPGAPRSSLAPAGNRPMQEGRETEYKEGWAVLQH